MQAGVGFLSGIEGGDAAIYSPHHLHVRSGMAGSRRCLETGLSYDDVCLYGVHSGRLAKRFKTVIANEEIIKERQALLHVVALDLKSGSR